MFIPTTVNAQNISDSLKSGPYIETLRFEVISDKDQQILSLLNNEIDIIGNIIEPEYLGTLSEANDISVGSRLMNGYTYVSINCAKYPFSETAFRRALAFALDKEGISTNVWQGLSEPLDACVPKMNPFSAENELDFSYYEANVEYGNYLLDQAGFEIDGNTGFRTAPDGSAFEVVIETSQSSNSYIEASYYVADALTELNIDAIAIPTDFYEYLERIYCHGEYDIVMISESFSDFDVYWLAYEYWSDYAETIRSNFPNFSNTSYDNWRNQLLYSIDYDEVHEAAIEMQRIIAYECPIIVLYQDTTLSAYRNDKFDGFQNDINDGVSNWWTYYRSHLKDDLGGPYGGTLRICQPIEFSSFNFMMTSIEYDKVILPDLYDSLLRVDPDGNDINWLAESYFAETHADNPEVREGNIRFTFDIIDNATWSDGMPLTAYDIAFSLNYYRDSLDNPYGADLGELDAAYAPIPSRIVVEFNTESYWHLHNVAYKLVIPKHVFTEIGLNGAKDWNPDPINEEMVISGPFNVTAIEVGDYIELSNTHDYFYEAGMQSETTTDSTTTDSTTVDSSTTAETTSDSDQTGNTNPSTPSTDLLEVIANISVLSWAITIPSLMIIIVVIIKWKNVNHSVMHIDEAWL